MAYNDSTTIGDIFRLRTKVLRENDIFNLGKRRLAKVFMRELLCLKADACDEYLESSYKACSPRKDIPANSEDYSGPRFQDSGLSCTLS